MFDLTYSRHERGKSWKVRIELSPEEHPGGCPVSLELFDRDVARLPTYEPERSRLMVTRTLDRATGNELLAMLDKIKVPIVPRAELIGGFEGRTEELKVTRGECVSAFKWWYDLPEGWDDLGAVAARVLKLVEGYRTEVLAQ